MPRLKQWTKAALFILAMGAPQLATAQGDAPPEAQKRDTLSQREALKVLLSAHHGLPAKIEFDRVSDNARGHLLDFATDMGMFPMHRYRALEALGMHYRDDQVLSLYEKVLLGSQGELAQHRVMMMAATFFGSDAVRIISPLIKHDDLQLRKTASSALLIVGDEAAMAAIRGAYEVEPDPTLRAEMGASLAILR